MKVVKLIAINLLVFLVLFELVSLVLIRGFHFESPPPFYMNKYPIAADMDSTFGAWHLPNTYFYHHKICFAVMNYYNEYGARDRSRKKTCSDCHNRVVVLGDSFMEGFGVDTSQRFSNILERETGKEFLNFGIQGAGTTQYRLVYEKLASQFDHSTVLIGLFPSNDLEEDSYTSRMDNRYRPYLIRDSSGYNLTYYTDDMKKSSWYPENVYLEMQGKDWIKTFLKNYTHSARLASAVKRSIDMRRDPEIYNTPFAPRLNHFTPEELDIVKYNLLKIQEIKPGVRVVVFTVQSVHEVAEYIAGGEKKINEEISRFCEENDMEYIDLLDSFSAQPDYRQLFIDCDGHWSAVGNQLAARIVKPYLMKIASKNMEE